jgi:predicted dehydrogenase
MENIKNGRVKIAVIGLGKMGLLHASLLNVLPSVKLAVLCDKSGLIRKICRRLFRGVFIADDVEELAGLDLDAVYITTPIPSHFSVVKTIYSKGIARNLFVEKTLASSYDAAREICLLAQCSHGVNMVGYMKRFAVTFNKARELLSEGVIGEMVSFEAYAYSSDFANVEECSVSVSRGGVLGDLGSHVLDLALWYFGDLKVDSAKLVSLNSFGTEDVASFKVSASSGLQGQFDISWCKKGFRMPELGLVIYGGKGKITVNDDELRLELINGESRRWYRHDLNDSVGFLLGASEYFREDKHFIESVLNGSNAEPSFATASKVDFLIDQVKEKCDKNE